MKLRFQLLAFVGVSVAVWPVRAQTFVWSPAALSGVFELNTNWTGALAPTPGAALVFGVSTQPNVTLGASIDVASLSFDGSAGSLGYSFAGANTSTLGVGTGGIILPNTGSGYVEFTSTLGLSLTSSQTWQAGGGWSLQVASNIAGGGRLTKTGEGTLRLAGTNSYSGGTVINGGAVELMASGALGAATGNLTINASGDVFWAALEIGSSSQSIGALTFGGANAANHAHNSIGMGVAGRLTLGGNVTYNASNGSGEAFISGGTLALGGARTFHITDSPNAFRELVITSTIDGAALIKTGLGTLELAAANTYSGGTTVHSGILLVAANNALPPAGNLVLNATGGQVTIDVGSTSQSIGSLTFGGTGASAFGRNRVAMYGTGSLTLGGPVSFIAANGPGEAFIEGGLLGLGAANRIFDIGESPNAPIELSIASRIDGTGGMSKDGAGTLFLSGQNTFSGAVTVNAGTLLVGSSTMKDTSGQILSGPVGRGTLTLQTGATLGAGYGSYSNGTDELVIANAISLANDVTLGSSAAGGGPDVTLSGTLTASAAATTVHLGHDGAVVLSGPLMGATAGTVLTFDRPAGQGGVAVLAGPTNANISRITADGAAIIVANSAAAPETVTLGAMNGGYLGVAATALAATPSPAMVLNRITDKANFSGTFGLDTDGDALSAVQVFTDNLDLSGFGANFTLGSLSAAIVTGTITPPAGGYAFGNGGGVLVVRSSLADVGGSKPVSVNSTTTGEEGALLAIFQGSNTFTGGLSVANSGAILDSIAALPAGQSVALGANGYLGHTEAFAGLPNLAALAPRLSAYASTSILGYDSHQFIATALTEPDATWLPPRFVMATVDLTDFASIYLGSATHAVVLAPVLAPNQSGANRTLSLIGISEGLLEMQSRLVAGNVGQVIVGSPSSPFEHGAVVLAAQNTFAGGTTLHSGTLLVGESSRVSGTTVLSGPLGTGALTVASSGHFPTLASSSGQDAVIHNPILLGGPLQLGLMADYDDMHSAASTDSSGFDGYYNRLVLSGVIGDLSATQAGTLHIQGDTVLTAANTFTGGVVLREGELVIGHNSALGAPTGVLNINPISSGSGSPYVALSVGDEPRTIANPLVLNSPGTGYVTVQGNGSLTITGAVSLNGDLRFDPRRFPLYLNGPVSGFAPLRSAGNSPIVLNSASNTYGGGTISDWGAIIFGTASSIPATNRLTAYWSGYIGVASPTFTTSLQANFLDRFEKSATYGTVGFDSLTPGTTNTFGGAIDLTGFGWDARLGSATRAVLTGAFTPPGSRYSFGGGGGFLEVNTSLADAGTTPRSVWVGSNSDAPLTVRLGGTNTFTGGAAVDSSALIFKAGALPASGALTASFGAYIGTEDTALAPVDFINRFENTTRDAIIGFDSFSGAPYAASGAVALTRFDSTTDPRIFLGSATSATISGSITLPGAQNVYRFAGYKGGRITIASTLDGARGVEIGDPANIATLRAPGGAAEMLSSVTLSGANVHSGGTRLFGGALGIGSDSALGLGTLSVEGMSYYHGYDARPRLFASGARSVSNPISVATDLEVGGSDALALTGSVFGEGGIYKTGAGTLTLSGSNTFGGGIYIAEGNVTFGSFNAAGTGLLQLGGLLAPSATFAESAVVNGISGDSNLDVISIGAAKTLTVNQTHNATYAGQFSLGIGARLIYTGPDAGNPRILRLTGGSSYGGATTISSGIAVVAAATNAFGASTNTVQLDGGKLVLDSGVTLTNALALNAGALGGTGTFQPPTTLHVGNQVTLAPGFHHPGTLNFSDRPTSIGTVLSLESGGMYRWRLGDATNANGGWDRIAVSGAVDFAATATAPFTFQILPAGALDLVGSVINFNPLQAYSWTVLTAASISGFAPAKIALDSFAVGSLVAGGTFNFSLNGSNTALFLNFTPVPEPSTYVLLGLGAVVLMLAQRRRRS